MSFLFPFQGCLLNGLALALAQVSELGAFQSAIIVLLGASVYVFVEGEQQHRELDLF